MSLIRIICYTHCRSFIRPTHVGGSLISTLSLFRWSFLLYSLISESDFIPIEHLQPLIAVAIGVAIGVECLFSIMSYIFQLQFMMAMKELRIRLHYSACFILLLMVFSVFVEVPLFLQVRVLWVQHMPKTMQILQYVPSLLQVIHSLMQGTYNYIAYMA